MPYYQSINHTLQMRHWSTCNQHFLLGVGNGCSHDFNFAENNTKFHTPLYSVSSQRVLRYASRSREGSQSIWPPNVVANGKHLLVKWHLTFSHDEQIHDRASTELTQTHIQTGPILLPQLLLCHGLTLMTCYNKYQYYTESERCILTLGSGLLE